MTTTVDHDERRSPASTAGPSPAGDTLRAVRDLAPAVASRAGEVEAARRLPADLLARLVDAGCFRLSLPTSHGGAAATLPQVVEMIEVLSRADASVGWTVMIGSGGWCDLAGLPRATFDALYGRGDVITAGVFAPSGTATPTGGGYRVTGRWSFASGCEHATWIYGNCLEPSGGDDPPRMRMVVFEPDQVDIEDTWNVSGLRGTGSHHIRADAVVVPADRTLAMFADPPCVEAAVLRIPVPQLYGLCVAGVALGIARGAIDDITTLAAGKVPLLDAAPLATNPLFQHDLAATDTRVRAAAGLLREVVAETWATALEGAEFAPADRARARAAAVWVTDQAVAAVSTAYRAGGGSAIYADCPLQRRLRDVHAVTQHFLVKPATLVTAGAVLAGQDADLTVF